MDLFDRCSHEFDALDRRKGLEYFESNQVAIRSQTGKQLRAQVFGSTTYDVILDWSEADMGALMAWCSCPRFDDMGICKHLVATILQADLLGIDRKVPGRGRLDIDPTDLDEHYASDEGSYDEDEDDDFDVDFRPRRQATRSTSSRKTQIKKGWKWLLDEISLEAEDHFESSAAKSLAPVQYWYLFDTRIEMNPSEPVLYFYQSRTKKDGTQGGLTLKGISRYDLKGIESPEDRAILDILLDARSERDDGYFYHDSNNQNRVWISAGMGEMLFPRIAATGRLGYLVPVPGSSVGECRPLRWDDGPPWNLSVAAAKSEDENQWQISASLSRGVETTRLDDVIALFDSGVVMFRDKLARCVPDRARFASALREASTIAVPVKDEGALIERLAKLSQQIPIIVPDELKWTEEQLVPMPSLRISKPSNNWAQDLRCDLSFRYDDRLAKFDSGDSSWFEPEGRRLLRRDLEAEAGAARQLVEAGAKTAPRSFNGPIEHSLNPKKLPALVRHLSAAGWEIEAEGKVIRNAGSFTFDVTSGVDWFELEGNIDFGGVSASLPQLLAALKRGEHYVKLDDGSQGILPEDWLKRYAPLAEMGQPEGDHLRYERSQALLIDALVAAQESNAVRLDADFVKFRDKLKSFAGIEPCSEPQTFHGKLRNYQREGLGWLNFLDDFGFGGCLADDMGLGKTIQVLAMLDARRAARPGSKQSKKDEAIRRTSLVVVPKSLVFNWVEEARRFTPNLSVLNYTGLDRKKVLSELDNADVMVTTYGTLRRDIASLSKLEFDYVILDEAQAIKNSSSQSAKSCRLLKANRRLAMTGTPVENHLGELWSLFEFLNPGMLGRGPKIIDLFSGKRRATLNGSPAPSANTSGSSATTLPANGKPAHEEPAASDTNLLARALRPFLLRRTKSQVLTELPPKMEQTLYCELEGDERRRYNELRDYYRDKLLKRVTTVGVNKTKIQVLEALLRLRQAACHPGLLDKNKISAESAKLEALLERIEEVIGEGHKALVFSQFTSLLAIVRARLDSKNIVYEYLDGRTTKRQAKVERFQSDADCPLFLISLKAGGHGLNLTAADYVFILDPWWNPAVEAQAIDRAHRMGQERNVFAYRLIARDTVEEKILQLQEQKRDLAEAIISADNSILRNLTAEDLQLLLS